MADKRTEAIISIISQLKCEEGDFFVKKLSEGEKIITDFVYSYTTTFNNVLITAAFLTSEFKFITFAQRINGKEIDTLSVNYYDFSDYKIDEQTQTKEDLGKTLQKKLYKIDADNYVMFRGKALSLMINHTKTVPKFYKNEKPMETKGCTKVEAEKPSLLRKMFG